MASSSTMDVPLPWPGYLIYRDHPADQPPDPTTPPLFFPPKDSDELFDALRLRFPGVKTHSERMRDAIIAFLIEERQAEQLQHAASSADSVASLPLDHSLALSSTLPFDQSLPSPSTLPLDHSLESPWQQSWPSGSSHPSSTWSSPETLGLATPSLAASPPTKHTPVPASTEATTAGLEQMTGVFALSTTTQPKLRNRRKMTDAEKLEYRARRIVKACEKCAKRKRKCQHNQPEVQHLTAKPSSRAKSHASLNHTPASRASIQPPQLPPDFDFDMFGIEEPFMVDDLSFQGINDLFEEQPGFDSSKQSGPYSATTSFHTDHATARHSWPEQQWLDGHDWQLPDPFNAAGHGQQIGSPVQHAADNIPHAHEAMTFDPAELAAGNWSGNSGPESSIQVPPRRGRMALGSGGSGVSRTGVDSMTPSSSPVSQSSSLRSPSIGVGTPSPASSSPRHGTVAYGTSVAARKSQQNAEENIRYETENAIPRPANSTRASTSTSALCNADRIAANQFHTQEAATSVAQGRLSKQPALVTSIDRAASPSTELYMLKRRVRTDSNTRSQIKPARLLLQSEESNVLAVRESQANGGAYPRLETKTLSQPSANVATTAADVLAAATKPSITSGSSATMLNQDRRSDHMLCRDHYGRSSPFAERLSDHWRYRDHHGRNVHASPASGMAALVVAVVGVAMLAVRAGASVSMLFVALAVCVQCTTKNSSWLTKSARLLSSPRLAARKERPPGSAVMFNAARLRVCW